MANIVIPSEVLTTIKTALRVSDPDFDSELIYLIRAAIQALIGAGANADSVSALEDDDVISAIGIFCKARFGIGNPDAQRLEQLFEREAIRIAGVYPREIYHA